MINPIHDIDHVLLSEQQIIGDLCNGSTTDSDSVCGGSNPSSPARKKHAQACFFRDVCSHANRSLAMITPLSNDVRPVKF